jgi:hypothetical protein
MLHQNQYGFIKGKTIHDCLGWAFEYLHLRHISKKPIIIMKIDFEQAFDKVEFNAIIAMCKVLGIGPRFLSWITNILHSASTSVLLNGVPGKKIFSKRGVRQGDPLSPLLFVATAELLQYIINQAWYNGELDLPLDNDYGQQYPIIQYADDTLLIMPAEIGQIQHLKTLVLQFSDATSLRVNFNKTTMVPINVPLDTLENLANDFGCKIEALPFTYLGFPLGTTRPSVDDLIEGNMP